MKNFILLIMLCCLFFPLKTPDSLAATKRAAKKPLYSEQNTPVLYTRTNIILQRKTSPLNAPMPWQTQGSPQESALTLDVEIRDGMSLYRQNDWINLSSYSEKSGVMMVFSEPDTQPIIHSTQYAPVDILFIDKNGRITQIVPEISLSELDQEIYPDAPVLAFLFLKGGACAELSINVGDEVQYSLFKKPPTIINKPKETTVNTQQPTIPVTYNDHP